MKKLINEELIDVKAATKIIGCATVTIIRWCKKGYVDCQITRVGLKNSYKINKASLLKYWEIRKKYLK